MESGSNKESKASSDEAVSSPGPTAFDDDAALSPPAPASARPYYECVFCKRGFTTAQALGGHMNIHRRDRAKPGRADAPAASVSRHAECYSAYRQQLHPPAAAAPKGSFTMYYHGAESTTAGGMDAEVSPGSPSPRELSLFGAARDELRLGLSCYGHVDAAVRAPEGPERQAGEPERELDLELRLGRRHRH